MPPDASTIRAEMLRQLQVRGLGNSICPSEVARALATDWHGLMKSVRSVAIALVVEGRIDILRKGRPVTLADAVPEGATAGASEAVAPAATSSHEVKGVIRLRLRPDPA
nr:DUF3253 domain-containing protein [uncultured Lichenicoccus sp.]